MRVTSHYYTFVPLGKTRELVVHARGRWPIKLSGSEQEVSQSIGILSHRAPWALAGYTPDARRAMSIGHRHVTAAAIEQRRLQMRPTGRHATLDLRLCARCGGGSLRGSLTCTSCGWDLDRPYQSPLDLTERFPLLRLKVGLPSLNRRVVAIGTLLLVATAALFPPWNLAFEGGRISVGFGFLLNPPCSDAMTAHCEVALTKLALEAIAILSIGAAVCLALPQRDV